MEQAGEKEPQAQAVSPIGEVADETLTDQLSDQLAATSSDSETTAQELTDPMQEVPLEEEQVKDEIDIQIDLLKDPDWVVRREAAITLGEMEMSVVSNRLRAHCETAIGRFERSRLMASDRLVLQRWTCCSSSFATGTCANPPLWHWEGFEMNGYWNR